MAHDVSTYVIVGTGAAGISAAQAIRQRDPAALITLIGDDPHGFYSRPGLAYYLTGELAERQLFLRQAGPFVMLTGRVTGLDVAGRRVITADGREHHYDRLLLATGSAAGRLPTAGAELKGVVKLDNLEDAREIVRRAGRGRTAVVVGGGITALEIVEALAARGVSTNYLLRSDRYWPNVLDETESRLVEQRLRNAGVRIHYRTQLACIFGKHGRVAAVETDRGERIKCHLVAGAIGVEPRLELARLAGLKIERAIATDEYLQTSAPDVYAAGDAVQESDDITHKPTLDTLWSKALRQGRIAGANMAGDREQYRRRVPFNVTRLAGLTTTIIGRVNAGPDDDLVSIARGDSETWRQLPEVMAVQWHSRLDRTRVLVARNTIIGAVVMGDQTLSRPLQQLIANRVDVTSIAERLRRAGDALSDAIIGRWLEWSHGTAE